jgi:hypothetical protein
MAILNCKHCFATEVPDSLTKAMRQRAADQVRAGSRVKAQLLLHKEAGLRLETAKGIVLHLASEPCRCQRCKAEVAGQEYDLCARCGALTINW